MKKVISGKELEEKTIEAINLLCDTVKKTLGPKGNNIIIDHSSFTPFITNDGVTIAENIESDDEAINTILQIAKEAAIKTNEVVGDGTTTTLVLLQSIYNSSMEYIKKRENPIILKKELEQSLEQIIKKLSSYKIKPTKEMLNKIAKISANDEEMGNLVSKVYNYVENKNSILIKEKDQNSLKYTHLKGYILDTSVTSPYFFKNNSEISFKDAYVLVFNNDLNDINEIGEIINFMIESNENFVIFANNFSESFINDILSLYLSEQLNTCLLKISEYGIKKNNIEKDLEVITNGKVIQNLNNLSLENLGLVKNIYINKDSSRIDFDVNKSIKSYIANIKKEETRIQDTYEKEFYLKRLSMFTKGIVEIEIGAPTKIELREKRMRLDDAICAIFSAKDGVLPGSGISLLRIASEVKKDSTASKILSQALLKPFEQIMENAGENVDKIKKVIEEKNYELVYNIHSQKYEELNNTNVIDSFSVITYSLINACSIASMLITTTSLIINEKENNLDKISDYGNV